MHEVSLMQSALNLAIEQIEQAGAQKIHRLELHVGELSGVVPDALMFAFDVVSTGTPAEGAELLIKTVPTQCYCDRCDRLFHPTSWVFNCPRCQQISTDIRQGQDLQLASLEVS
ncbi:hydrogenase nickel insertion protein HypA [Synechococcus sp. PCC 7335]|uniref:hydrogenase maturation nickel metallochaperone HypA n=1 Tax=Synechococcus sp. (strain ATCC 29403 / PCC 7335) TaxID=91464 RepID=UPI00017EE0FF|nr:hydrogenase maturation nickel metallochaperone HypA [Synechococcus sp. PCC 7335]EDX83023.1 hydrogenase nickel insertion protein HypA [Synechococcus sp. PCC 7335]